MTICLHPGLAASFLHPMCPMCTKPPAPHAWLRPVWQGLPQVVITGGDFCPGLPGGVGNRRAASLHSGLRHRSWRHRHCATCLTFRAVASINTLLRESGGIGKRTRLRIWRSRPWGFKSPLSHQWRVPGSSRDRTSRKNAHAHTRAAARRQGRVPRPSKTALQGIPSHGYRR